MGEKIKKFHLKFISMKYSHNLSYLTYNQVYVTWIYCRKSFKRLPSFHMNVPLLIIIPYLSFVFLLASIFQICWSLRTSTIRYKLKSLNAWWKDLDNKKDFFDDTSF